VVIYVVRVPRRAVIGMPQARKDLRARWARPSMKDAGARQLARQNPRWAPRSVKPCRRPIAETSPQPPGKKGIASGIIHHR